MKLISCTLLQFGIILFFAADGFACSCSLGNTENKLRNHPNVFLGTATRVERLDEKNNWGEQRIRVYFDVEKRWKGKPDESMLDTWDNKVGCEGFWFKENKEYIVYARKGKNGFTLSYCGGATVRTEEKGRFEEELEYLETQPLADPGDASGTGLFTYQYPSVYLGGSGSRCGQNSGPNELSLKG